MAVAMVALTGCAREARISTPATYELVGGDGHPLPLLLETDTANAGCFTQLEGGTLVLQDESWYKAQYQIRRLCTPRIEPLPDPGVTARYTVHGDSISFQDPAGKPAGAGRISRDSVIIVGPEHTLTFRRRMQRSP